MTSALFDVRKQLTFYGAYHNNPINVLIHVVCVPILLWTGLYMANWIPTRDILPPIHYHFNDYLSFDLNIPAIYVAISLAFYLILEPTAAIAYLPQGILMLLTATALSQNRPDAFTYVLGAHAVCWIMQFIGHGVAEKRAPALLDNLVQALLLAPFFVHLEILFTLFGYNQPLQKQLKNDVGAEITRIRKLEGDKRRAAEVKSQ